MSVTVENWGAEQDALIQNLSEAGGYLFIPEKDGKRGIVLKLEKDGIISDVALSLGYQRASLDKDVIIGTSIKEYNNRFKGKQLKDKIKTAKEKATYNYAFNVGIQIPEEEHLFDFEKMSQTDEVTFNIYKQAEQTRENRYKSAEAKKDPFGDKIEYSPAEKTYASSNIEKEVLATAVKNFNKSRILHNLYQISKNKSRR